MLLTMKVSVLLKERLRELALPDSATDESTEELTELARLDTATDERTDEDGSNI